MNSHLVIALSQPIQGMNPSIWKFTGLDWQGTAVIDTMQLIDDSLFPIPSFDIDPDRTCVLIEAAPLDPRKNDLITIS